MSMEPCIFILQHKMLILSNNKTHMLSDKLFWLTSDQTRPSQFPQPTFWVRRRTCLDQTINFHFQSRWFSPTIKCHQTHFQSWLLQYEYIQFRLLCLDKRQRIKKMGQYLLLNLNHCNISIKTQQRISKPGTSQTDRNVINEKFKEERIQHETFTYCDRCQFYSALFLPKKRDRLFNFSLISLHNFCTAPFRQIQVKLNDWISMSCYCTFLHISKTYWVNCNKLQHTCYSMPNFLYPSL